jgi:2-succinyl-5-enolpyruvyl-6-hydroxy-3-cyclohexene-1-carboxylate synthase
MKVEGILDFLKQVGVTDVVCAPGGRCKELLQAFLKDKAFKVTTAYDERTAGFYALGLSFKRPTVVLTTSGTAVTELSSAMAEAYYQKDSKLIALTADRPISLRHTGAPQSLNQFEVFKNFSRSFIDLEENETPLKSFKISYPAHINVCLDEPNPLKSLTGSKAYGPLIIASELNEGEQKKIKEALKDYDGALVLEPLSNLKKDDFPKAKLISFAEPFLNSFGLSSFDFVVRLGGVPVLKSWREIDDLKTFYWGEASYFPGGVGVEEKSLSEIKDLLACPKELNSLEKDVVKFSNKVFETLNKYPDSEASLLNKLSLHINEEDEVFIGNSLPIREWDYVQNKNYKIFGQRGVNGIDGSLAFAMGRLNQEKTSWIIVGDLTFLYNFNDLQLLEDLPNRNIRIVVVNNFGGQIFSRVIKDQTEAFLNSHQKSFSKIAEFWGLSYSQNTFVFNEEQMLLELNPNAESSNAFWNEIGKL